MRRAEHNLNIQSTPDDEVEPGVAQAEPPKRKGRKPGSKNKPKAPANGAADSANVTIGLDLQMSKEQIVRVLTDYVVAQLEAQGFGGTMHEMELQVNHSGPWVPLKDPIRFANKGKI